MAKCRPNQLTSLPFKGLTAFSNWLIYIIGVLAADSVRTLTASVTRSPNETTSCCNLSPELIMLPPRLSALAGSIRDTHNTRPLCWLLSTCTSYKSFRYCCCALFALRCKEQCHFARLVTFSSRSICYRRKACEMRCRHLNCVNDFIYIKWILQCEQLLQRVARQSALCAHIHCLVTEAQGCKQLAYGCCAAGWTKNAGLHGQRRTRLPDKLQVAELEVYETAPAQNVV